MAVAGAGSDFPSQLAGRCVWTRLVGMLDRWGIPPDARRAPHSRFECVSNALHNPIHSPKDPVMSDILRPKVSAGASNNFFASRGLPLGIQLFMLGKAAATDLVGTMTHLASIGYRAVELPGHKLGDAKRSRAAADAAGISITSVHIHPRQIGESMSVELDAGQIAAEVQALGATDVTVPFPLLPPYKPEPGEGMVAGWRRAFAAAGDDHWKRTADFFNQKGEALQRHGVHLNYHNHNFEFKTFGGTMTGWELLVANTDPEQVSFEVDIGWVAAAGLDPVEFLRRHAGRLRQMHVKDLKATTPANFQLEIESTEVGGGRLQWAEILPEAYAAGVRQFFVEQEPPFEMDRFDAAAKSYAYLAHQI